MPKYNKILVTGGFGFIGWNFVKHMFKKHEDVKIAILDKRTYASVESKSIKLLHDDQKDIGVNNFFFNIVDIEEDINNIEERKADCWDEIDSIVHFAAESHVDRSINNSSDFIKTNINGTHALLEFARKRNLRFHHISTDEVFGSISEGHFNESSPYDPKSPYSASKAASDHLVRAYHNTYGLPVTITNCSNNYGPFQHPEKLIPLCITNTIRQLKTPVYGDGKNIRDWIHVEDHCEAIDCVLQNGRIGETYCVGGNSEEQNIDIVKTILTNLEKDPEEFIEYVEDRKGHDRRYAVDPSKIKKELGWAPKIKFKDGIRKTIGWYKDNEEWWMERI